jgi:hypothetical protein
MHQFRKNENLLEVIYANGHIVKYSAKDGELLSEESATPPELNADEIFYANGYTITSPLHGTPTAEKDGKIYMLEPDAYLTYVTELPDGLSIIEYVTTDGKRYGLLLNSKLETISRFDNLCDISGEKLYFDSNGEIRESRIYSLEDLLITASSK